MGYLPDNMGFYPDMTGRENLRMTGRMNGLQGEALEARMDELLQRVGMLEAADRRAGAYSKGMKQRLGIADILKMCIRDRRKMASTCQMASSSVISVLLPRGANMAM